MSLTNQIRDVLKTASGPMTATEISEACEAASKDVQGALAPMVKRGEVASDGQGQSRTFTLDASWKPGKGRAAAAQAAAKPRRTVRATAPAAKGDALAPAANDDDMVMVPRRAVRLLAAAALASNADLGEHIREAVIEAIKAA